MPSAYFPCDEHRDLYLALLKKAEKEADKKLVRIILKKLQISAPQPEMTKDGCMVFAFPTGPASAGVDADRLFWKNSQFWQDLLQFMAFLTVGIGFFIFFCSLICGQVVR